MKTIKSWEQVEGRQIDFLYDCDRGWQKEEVKGAVPPGDKMPTFELRCRSRDSLLVLDTYGDEWVPPDLWERVHPHDGLSTVAIDTVKGTVYHAGFVREGKRFNRTYSLTIYKPNEQALVVPKPYLARLSEVRSAKRPFAWSLDNRAVMNFATRYYGLEQLGQTLVLSLDFRDEMLELSDGTWRSVGKWKMNEERLEK